MPIERYHVRPILIKSPILILRPQQGKQKHSGESEEWKKTVYHNQKLYNTTLALIKMEDKALKVFIAKRLRISIWQGSSDAETEHEILIRIEWKSEKEMREEWALEGIIIITLSFCIIIKHH